MMTAEKPPLPSASANGLGPRDQDSALNTEVLASRLPAIVETHFPVEMVAGKLKAKNVTIGGRRTSMRLEPPLWSALEEIAQREGLSVNEICSMVAETRHSKANVTGAVRTFIAAYFRDAATEDGHRTAGHGAPSVSVPPFRVV